MAKIHDNGGVIGKTLNYNSTNSYTTGSTNKKNSGIWSLASAVKSAPPASYDNMVWPSSVFEGDSSYIQVNTSNVPDGTTVDITASGTNITTSDFSSGFNTSLTQTITINNNQGTVNYQVAADAFTEGNETVEFTLAPTDSAGNSTSGISYSATVSVTDSSKTVTYQLLTINTVTPDEGTSVAFTYRVSNSTETLYWTINGTTSDFSAVSGSTTYSSTSASGNDTWFNHSVSIPITADLLTEGNEAYTFTLRSGSTSGPAKSGWTFTVQDTSVTPGTAVLYGVYGYSDSTPGESTQPYIDFYVSNDQSTMYWSIDSGTSDFDTGSGSVNWFDGVPDFPNTGDTSYIYRVNLSVTADATTEGDEIHYVRFRTGSTSGTIEATGTLTVQDTSQTPEPSNLAAGTPSQMIVAGSGTIGDPYTAESANKINSTVGSIVFTASAAGTVYWATKASSETNFDWARFKINNVQVSQVSGDNVTDSGNAVIADGDTVEFQYTKDVSSSSYLDTGYLTSLYLVPLGTDYSSGFTEYSNRHIDSDIYMGSTADYNGPYDVWQSDPVLASPNGSSARVYLAHKFTSPTSYYSDAAVACVQHFNSGGTLLNSWNFSSTIGINWETTITAIDQGTTGMSTSPATASGFTYQNIATGATANRFNYATSTGSSYTGAADGIDSTYNTTALPGAGNGVVSQSAGTYYIYAEASGSVRYNATWARSPLVTISTGDYFRIAHALTGYSANVQDDTDAMWFAIY